MSATLRNLLIVFLLTGLWHGAAWSFVVWGLYHGAFLMAERFGLGRLLERLPKVIRHGYALLAIVVGWVIFRAADLPSAGHYLKAMFAPQTLWKGDVSVLVLLNAEVVVAMAIGAMLAFPTLPSLLARLNAPRADETIGVDETRAAHILPIIILMIGLILSVAHLANSSLNPFLYFRF